jgi:hypothetical protein
MASGEYLCEFRFAVMVIILVFYGIMYSFARYGHTFARYLKGGAPVMIFFNVFIPRLAGFLIIARCAPGVVSGVLLNIPVTVYLLKSGVRKKYLQQKKLVLEDLFLL